MNQERALRKELLAYHFGIIEEDIRIEVEEQLLQSESFLMEYIALKRSLEVSPVLSPESEDLTSLLPSPSVKQKLRNEVEGMFCARRKPTPVFRLNRELGLQWGALAAGILLALSFGSRLFVSKPVQPNISLNDPSVPEVQISNSATEMTANDRHL